MRGANHIYFLIMAGGEGVRFQPLSTPARPKQFINIVGTKSLIRQTFERIGAVPANVYVATNARYLDLVRKELPEVPIENIIGETSKKNTAPCIGFAAHMVSVKDPEAVMVCLPSDHVILNSTGFVSAISSAVETAVQTGMLVTIGVKPCRAATEYGYIEKGDEIAAAHGHTVFRARRFVEKPDKGTADQYLASGRYFWNSGMFIWLAASILTEISHHLPDLAGEIGHLSRHIDMSAMINFFENAPSISVDYGVMEKSSNVALIPCDFGWSDVGGWKSLKELADSGAVEVTPEVRRIMEEQLNLKH